MTLRWVGWTSRPFGLLRAGVAIALSLVALGWPPVHASAAAATANPYNSLTLEWTAPGDDGLTGTVSAYAIGYSTTPVGSDSAAWWNSVPYAQRITLLPPLAAAGRPDSTTITGLAQGTVYYFMLVALDEASNSSGFSNVAEGATQSCGAPSTAPQQLEAQAESTGILVRWAPPSDTSVHAIHLYRAAAGSSSWELAADLPPTTLSYFDGSVGRGAAYSYRAAWGGPPTSDGYPCEGPFSNLAQATASGVRRVAATVSGSVHVYPNPSSGPLQVALDVQSTSPAPVQLRLYDLSGHWLGTIADGLFPPGRSLFRWERRSRSGGPLPPGYYEILGTVGSRRVRERVVLLP